jgi:hypothetical protein
MNRANQINLVQNTNMILISIRQIEVSYFGTFYSNFGTQSAILVGVIAGAVSQTPAYSANDAEFLNPDCNYFFVWLYFITSAATVIFGMQVLLGSTFMGVYGQGLALRGPLGSMISTIDGMIYEQKQTLISFVVAMISFVVSEACMFFIVMDLNCAVICSFIILLGGVYTYRVSLRIYNRFKFKSHLDFDETVDKKKVLDQLDRLPNEHLIDESNNDFVVPADLSSNISISINDANEGKKKKDKQNKEDNGTTVINIKNDVENDNNNSIMSNKQNKNVIGHIGGYITMKKNGKTFLNFNEPWERRYFLLRGSHIFYYKDKRAYELDPSKPMNSRPIELEGYSLVAGAVKEPPYLITLIPTDAEDIRKSWKFRCDTLHEFNDWIEKFSHALQNRFVFLNNENNNNNNNEEEVKSDVDFVVLNNEQQNVLHKYNNK